MRSLLTFIIIALVLSVSPGRSSSSGMPTLETSCGSSGCLVGDPVFIHESDFAVNREWEICIVHPGNVGYCFGGTDKPAADGSFTFLLDTTGYTAGSYLAQGFEVTSRRKAEMVATVAFDLQ